MRLVEKVNYGRYTIERTETTVHVIDPDARFWDRNNDGTVLAYDYGPGWIGCSETGNAQRTNDVMATVRGIIDSVDVGGFPDIDDDADRCSVCDAPTENGMFCSADCVAQAIDTQD